MELQGKYNVEDLFKNRQKISNTVEEKPQEMNLQVIKEKQNVFIRIIEKKYIDMRTGKKTRTSEAKWFRRDESEIPDEPIETNVI